MRRLKYIFILLLIFTLCLFGEDLKATENYCTDKESWEEWDELVEKYPDDEDIHTLHALRLGLCAKVERGDITVQQATHIFEKAREAIMNKKIKIIFSEFFIINKPCFEKNLNL